MDILQSLQSSPFVWIALAALLVLLSLVFLRRKAPAPAGGWKGFLYVNPADPALFVRKRWGFGYTVNFGNRWSWVLLVAVFALALAPLWYVIVAMRQVFNLPSN